MRQFQTVTTCSKDWLIRPWTGIACGAEQFRCCMVRRSMWESGGDQDCSMAVRLHFVHAQLNRRRRRQFQQPGNSTELEDSLVRQFRGHARLFSGGGVHLNGSMLIGHATRRHFHTFMDCRRGGVAFDTKCVLGPLGVVRGTMR